MTFITLNKYPDYEILEVYPFTIRRIGKAKPLTISSNSKGYPRVKLNSHYKQLHVVIADQFIPNPLNLPCVDHDDQNPENYHLENLIRCTQAKNNENRKSWRGYDYEYIDELPDNAFAFLEYGKHHFKDYYYADGSFYKRVNNKYRILRQLDKDKRHYVNAYDTTGHQTAITISVFQTMYVNNT